MTAVASNFILFLSGGAYQVPCYAISTWKHYSYCSYTLSLRGSLSEVKYRSLAHLGFIIILYDEKEEDRVSRRTTSRKFGLSGSASVRETRWQIFKISSVDCADRPYVYNNPSSWGSHHKSCESCSGSDGVCVLHAVIYCCVCKRVFFEFVKLYTHVVATRRKKRSRLSRPVRRSRSWFLPGHACVYTWPCDVWLHAAVVVLCDALFPNGKYCRRRMSFSSFYRARTYDTKLNYTYTYLHVCTKHLTSVASVRALFQYCLPAVNICFSAVYSDGSPPLTTVVVTASADASLCSI